MSSVSNGPNSAVLSAETALQSTIMLVTTEAHHERNRGVACFKIVHIFNPLGRENATRDAMFSGCPALFVPLSSSTMTALRGSGVEKNEWRITFETYSILFHNRIGGFGSSCTELLALTDFVPNIIRDNFVLCSSHPALFSYGMSILLRGCQLTVQG